MWDRPTAGADGRGPFPNWRAGPFLGGRMIDRSLPRLGSTFPKMRRLSVPALSDLIH